jgi:predicted GNAT family acetyltransferase
MLQGDEMIGYIKGKGTCTTDSEMQHESMSEHRTERTTLVVHSVTVAAAHRWKGIATKMLRRYVQYS